MGISGPNKLKTQKLFYKQIGSWENYSKIILQKFVHFVRRKKKLLTVRSSLWLCESFRLTFLRLWHHFKFWRHLSRYSGLSVSRAKCKKAIVNHLSLSFFSDTIIKRLLVIKDVILKNHTEWSTSWKAKLVSGGSWNSNNIGFLCRLNRELLDSSGAIKMAAILCSRLCGRNATRFSKFSFIFATIKIFWILKFLMSSYFSWFSYSFRLSKTCACIVSDYMFS